MKYQIDTGPTFSREFKQLAKKYHSLKSEVARLAQELAENPTLGESLGKNCYKIRLAIKSKGKGKRGGARVITCVISVEERVVLLSMYDKAEQDTISDDELVELLNAADLL